MPKWQLTLLFALCAGQFVRNIISTAPGRDPVTSDAKTLIGSHPLPKREDTSALATKMRLPSTDAARLSRGRRERLRVRRRHHGAQQPGRQVKTACSRTPTETLVGRLGPAFNARYMSISKPHRELSSVSASLGESPATSAQHRTQVDQSDAVDASSHGEFRVDQDFSRIVRVKATWQTTRESAEALRDRTKRATRPRKKPASSRKRPVIEQWECAQKIVWRDLGTDYFPRYLRSVACTQSTCWFGAFECRPRAFTVKVLRRISDECMPVYDGSATQTASTTGRLHQEATPVRYEQAWVFEELAVPFCCDCAARGGTSNSLVMLRGYAGPDNRT